MQTPYEYEQKMQAARERLRALLDPIDGPEKSIVTWLGGWDLPTITIIADMIERRIGESPQPEIRHAGAESETDIDRLDADQRHGDERREQ